MRRETFSTWRSQPATKRGRSDDAEAEKDETGGFGKLLSGLFGDPS